MRELHLLPLDGSGNPANIRAYASKFSGLAPTVAANVPNLLMWAITCITRQRDRQLGHRFVGAGNEDVRRLLLDELKQISVDLTTYTSLLRYRFPPHVHEALAKAAAD